MYPIDIQNKMHRVPVYFSGVMQLQAPFEINLPAFCYSVCLYGDLARSGTCGVVEKEERSFPPDVPQGAGAGGSQAELQKRRSRARSQSGRHLPSRPAGSRRG